jgi:hypothetical protein
MVQLVGWGFTGQEKTHSGQQEASGHDFTGCGKTHSGFMPGIYPRHKANQINEGFSP